MAEKAGMPDVVVLLPGITGSVLQRDGKDVWAFSPSAIARGLFSGFGSIKDLAVHEDDVEAEDLGDGVRADRVMSDLHLIPGLWKIDGYEGVTKALLRRFDLKEGRNFFPFPYDWRRDNRASARALQRQSTRWLQDWRRASGNDDAKLILIGHSMGGLVSRYFVEALGGWRDTRAIVTFGTPFYGSVNAIEFLVKGMRRGIGPLGVDLSPLLRSFPSVHQLVPVYKCVRDRSGADVKPADAGIPGWEARWNDSVAGFHQEMETAATANRQDPAWERDGPIYRPIVGTDQRTLQSAQVTASGVETLPTRAGRDEGGDGTVPRLSAALVGTERAGMFSPQQHARIQNYDSVLDHLSGLLTSLHTISVNDLRRRVTSWLSYDGGDVFSLGEPVPFQVALRSDADEQQLPGLAVDVEVTHRETGTVVERRTVEVARDYGTVELPPPPAAGVYTIELTAEGTAPVSDVFAVLADEDG